MRTQVPEKLLAIVEEIDAQGSASLTRLEEGSAEIMPPDGKARKYLTCR